MKESQSYFESMEQDNTRAPMVSHQSEVTPKSVAEDWQAGVYEMKSDAMDEAYGMAGKRDVEKDFGKAHSQFRNYNWA
jgi:hypothetical protein